jgi:ubiquinone/menaquinone biosynthesis C-methylase UbiE
MAHVNLSEDSLRQWSSVAPAWEAERARLFEMTRGISERLVERLDPQPGQTVLELCAGPGETGFLVAERLGADGRLISSDFAPAMVDAARRGAEARGLDNVEHRILDAQQIDLPDDRVDGVLARFGLMLVPEQGRAVAEIRRVLRPGGRCVWGTWGPPDRNPWIFSIVAALMANDLSLPGDPFAPGGVFSLSTPEPNRELAAAAGFEDVAVEEVTGTFRHASSDEYWDFNTSIAGPVAQLVRTLDADRLAAVRATLEPTLEPFRQDGALVLPWVGLVTIAR